MRYPDEKQLRTLVSAAASTEIVADLAIGTVRFVENCDESHGLRQEIPLETSSINIRVQATADVGIEPHSDTSSVESITAALELSAREALKPRHLLMKEAVSKLRRRSLRKNPDPTPSLAGRPSQTISSSSILLRNEIARSR